MWKSGSALSLPRKPVRLYSICHGSRCTRHGRPRPRAAPGEGMPDTLTLRLDVRVPPGLRGRSLVVEQRLTRRDVDRILAAFDAAG